MLLVSDTQNYYSPKVIYRLTSLLVEPHKPNCRLYCIHRNFTLWASSTRREESENAYDKITTFIINIKHTFGEFTYIQVLVYFKLLNTY